MKQLFGRFSRVLAVAVMVGLAGATHEAWGIVISLNPSKDNTMYQNDGTASNGTGESLFAGQTNFFGSRRALLAFDIAGSVPAGSTINSVSLTMTVNQTISGGHPASLHKVLADWGEGASNAGNPGGNGAPAAPGDATWTDRLFPGTLWTTPGGDFVLGASASTVVAGLGSYTWASTPALVADVQGWLNTPASDFGWVLIGNESTNPTAKSYHSRESLNGALQPTLTVDYTGPGGGGGGAVPTLSEWGLILMALLLLSAGTVLFGRRSVVAGSGSATWPGFTGASLPLVPGLFTRVLAVISGLLLLGLGLAFALRMGPSPVDLAGSMLCAPVLAYLVHLWLARDKE